MNKLFGKLLGIAALCTLVSTASAQDLIVQENLTGFWSRNTGDGLVLFDSGSVLLGATEFGGYHLTLKDPGHYRGKILQQDGCALNAHVRVIDARLLYVEVTGNNGACATQRGNRFSYPLRRN